MATPLKEIYDTFLSKVEDYSFIRLNESGDLEDLLIKYLKGAIVRFSNCTKELTVNQTKGVIVATVNNREQELNVYEIEILATLMVLRYSTDRIVSIKNMEMVLTKAEYYTYSQANHILALIELRKELQGEASHLMNIYSLKYGTEGVLN